MPFASKYASTASSTSAHVAPGTQRAERGAARAEHVVEQAPHLVGRLADDHRPLELGVVAPDRSARLADEHVAGLEGDVVRDRVRPRAPLADLAPVAGRDAVRRGEPAAVGRAERLVHRERRLVARAQAGRGFGRAGDAVLPAAAGARGCTSGRSRGSARPRPRSCEPASPRAPARAARPWRRSTSLSEGPS